MYSRVTLLTIVHLLSVMVSHAQIEDSTVSKPCLCTTYRWSDVYGWTDPLVDSIVYNNNGEELKSYRTAHTGYKFVNVVHYKNAPDLSERYKYHIGPNGDTIASDKYLFATDEFGKVILSQHYELKENSWQRKVTPGYYKNVSSTINLNPKGDIASSDETTFEALIYYYQTHRMFGYDQLGRMIYVLKGVRHSAYDAYIYDSTAYDVSEVLTTGALTSYRFLKDSSGTYQAKSKTVRQFEAFKFPDEYVTGDEYFDDKNKQIMKRVYHWAQIDTCYIGWTGVPFYVNCATCHWLEHVYSDRTEHLPNGGTVTTMYFRDLFAMDSIRTEKDEQGNITRELRYNYGVMPCGEPINCKREYVQKFFAVYETTYTRTYDSDGNEIDMIMSIPDQKNGKPVKFQRKQCTDYRSFPKH